MRSRWVQRASSRFTLAFVVFAISMANVRSQDGALNPQSQVETKSNVESLLLELDAPQLARRNAAEQAIFKLGREALPFLPKEGTPLSPEVAQRLERVRTRIAKESTAEEVKKNVGDVRLGDSSTLGEALEAISRDSGIEFEHSGNDEAPIEPYSAPLPFWHAVDYVLDQAELDIDFYSSEGTTLTLRPRAENRASRVDSAAYAGIYRLEPTMVTSRRVLTDATLSGMNIEMEISWKPDSNPVGITLPLNQIKARIGNGITIGPQQADGTIDIAPSNELAMTTIQLPLVLPAGRPPEIEALSGQINSLLPGDEKSFEFPLKLGVQTQTAEFVTVRLEEIRKNGPLHEVRLAVEYKSAGKAMESHRGWLIGNQIHVELADGTRQDHLGYELYRHNESGIGIGYMFDIGDAVGESKLVYRTPTAVIENTIDFVIQDIPLP